MKLSSIYRSDINRDINGVIKVAQNDEASIRQELSEYIITKELRRHFNTFFSQYERSLDVPTDRIGVWISGFFGSGKSHFLKMLSYILSNPVVAGQRAVEYFRDKIDDPMMFAQIERCAAAPTETILFNIDAKSPLNKDKTAILRIFAKVFYEQQGFYGADLKVAKLEAFITKQGRMDAFRAAFEARNGSAWESMRETYAFFEDDIVGALQDTLGISETAARDWFNGAEESNLSIEQLVGEIKSYIDARGKSFRLLFLVDEVGQYIGSDSDLMLNLQTLVEEIGARCGGRVWVVVTSQEAIDSITKISGDDFSKIQGRFNIRLSLSSSSVDEVIKKRILAKTETAENMLRLNYERNSAVLKNLFTFQDAVLDLKGYAGATDFVESYPFVPYQFRLMQNVLVQIRQHGNSGKHLSGGERSMLSGFQEAAQAIQDRDENALVPFSLFYDTVHTFLESPIRQVIDRCQRAAEKGEGLKPYDVEVLKLLYLIRYVDDIKANVDNLATLLVADIRADKILMRQEIQASLDRLLSQNYIARSGDTYTFLTDDEQDIAREIRNTVVDGEAIVRKIGEIIFNDIYPAKKYRYDRYDFAYDQWVDEKAIGQIGGASLHLRFLTSAADALQTDPQQIVMQSMAKQEAVVVLADYPYYEELEQAAKIRRYVKSRNITQLPEAIQKIIHARQNEAAAIEKRAAGYLTSAIAEGKFYAAGQTVLSKTGGAKERIDETMALLVESVYTKLSYIDHYLSGDEEILRILQQGTKQVSLEGMPQVNARAVGEVTQYLEIQEQRHLPTSMGDIQRRFSAIPYGWREIDIAGVVASLLASRRISLEYGGGIVPLNDRRIPDMLRRRSEVDKVAIRRKVGVSGDLLHRAREFYKGYMETMDAASDEDDFIAQVLDAFEKKQRDLQQHLAQDYAGHSYPGRKVLEDGIALCQDLLAQRRDSTVLLETMLAQRDAWEDLKEDLTEIGSFFAGQRPLFDQAENLLRRMDQEKTYLQADHGAQEALAQIREVLSMERPYGRMHLLPDAIRQVETAYGRILEEKREAVQAEIQAAMAELHQTAEKGRGNDPLVEKADGELTGWRRAAAAETTVTHLEAMIPQIQALRQRYTRALLVESEPSSNAVTMSRAAVCHVDSLHDEAEVDRYLATVRETLLARLAGHDVLHIV